MYPHYPDCMEKKIMFLQIDAGTFLWKYSQTQL